MTKVKAVRDGRDSVRGVGTTMGAVAGTAAGRQPEQRRGCEQLVFPLSGVELQPTNEGCAS